MELQSANELVHLKLTAPQAQAAHPPSPIESVCMPLPEKFDASTDHCQDFLRQYFDIFFAHKPELYRYKGTKFTFMMSLLTGKALVWALEVWDNYHQVRASSSYFSEKIKKVFEYPTGIFL